MQDLGEDAEAVSDRLRVYANASSHDHHFDLRSLGIVSQEDCSPDKPRTDRGRLPFEFIFKGFARPQSPVPSAPAGGWYKISGASPTFLMHTLWLLVSPECAVPKSKSSSSIIAFG
jgi:hypothetical protein